MTGALFKMAARASDPRKGLEGCGAATARSGGAGAKAERRKARFFAACRKKCALKHKKSSIL
jgi:hypothetical protein